MALLKRLETDACPFSVKPKTNERPHWVRPELVAQVKFTEWTADRKLRHPVYLGLRDDKRAEEVTGEGAKGANGAKGAKGAGARGAKGAKGAKGAEGAGADGASALRGVVEQLRG